MVVTLSIKRYYNQVSYTEEEVRALGYIKERDTGWYACSIFGETQSNLAHWDGNTNAQGVFIGWSLLTNYFPEPSFVIAMRERDTKYFAYVTLEEWLGIGLKGRLSTMTITYFCRERQVLGTPVSMVMSVVTIGQSGYLNTKPRLTTILMNLNYQQSEKHWPGELSPIHFVAV